MAVSQSTPAHPDEGVFTRFVLNCWTNHGVWARVATLLAGLVCLIGMTIFADAAGVPPLARFDGSLLSHNPAAGLCVVIVGLLVGTLLGTFLAGGVRFDAGLFAATVGLAALSVRGGTIEDVIYESGGTAAVFFSLALELAILAALVGGVWLILLAMGRSPAFGLTALPDTVESPDDEVEVSKLSDRLFAAAVNAVLFAILLMLLGRSDAKYQCLAAVGFGSIISAFGVHNMFPVRPSWIFWSGPLTVGVIGYLLAGCIAYSGIETGHPVGMFAALARPLPLDYASGGVAGSIMGYWMSRHAEKDNAEGQMPNAE